MSAKAPPPPLPPRESSSMPQSPLDAPPPYNPPSPASTVSAGLWSSQDPRSSSMQSLLPEYTEHDGGRRRLLLIYIHGFMGDEMSFRSFPAHLHHLLTVLLSDTHVVHTKVYPRYRSKRNISFARDDFSRWLEPHEDWQTDVVLLGHSMGGLLAAEIALMPSPDPASRALKHRILGTINFDVPFLGMHPGVVRSGLSSIFMPAEETHEDKFSPTLSPVSTTNSISASAMASAEQLPDALWRPEENDPTYNPSFQNDVVLPIRKGWKSAWHFINKHSSNLTELGNATKKLISSHMEFGGAMANYDELNRRYVRIRALEEDDAAIRKSVVAEGPAPPRVRFVNYYTASTGRPKKVKPIEASKSQELVADEGAAHNNATSLVSKNAALTDGNKPASPRISLEECRDDGSIIEKPIAEDSDTLEEEQWGDAAETLTIQDPRPVSDDETDADISSEPTADLSPIASVDQESTLPPIPELPPAPPPLDVSYIQDASTRKLVEKEHSRALKAHEQAMKNREKAIRDRARLAEKVRAQSQKDAQKVQKDAKKAQKDELKADQKAHEQRLAEERKQGKQPMTQQQKEELRLQQETARMEAEARRLRGEPEPRTVEDSNTVLTASETSGDRTLQSSKSAMSARDTAPSILSRTTTGTSSMQPSAEHSQQQQHDRKFCMLPPKDASGQRDPCWVRIFMENVDEVGAHCGLFFIDERYERLVGDVAERIEGWVFEAISQGVASSEKS
ncbi:hypothetical protein BAUCODRAFT_169256 [Baudoinia panamericana UAMH 10762]|uniref:AB hydrolase-1 domain-containing protein n=1 Tax=Baudoinia panamericana (strain UAMH 10762) TaxID=717646 RepID=M2NMN1_BAUPA|nr:uncharacterized protein BAUCODRAFT_169256 [Baudoinia panamericana UAMH 10762]EMD00446.1 hypothetical protein BAUCODRAFT_169256 [Baudoinia panamericana UAMH 10762]